MSRSVGPRILPFHSSSSGTVREQRSITRRTALRITPALATAGPLASLAEVKRRSAVSAIWWLDRASAAKTRPNRRPARGAAGSKCNSPAQQTSDDRSMVGERRLGVDDRWARWSPRSRRARAPRPLRPRSNRAREGIASAFVGCRRGIRGEVAAVATPVREHRRENPTVLVDVATRQSLLVEAAQELADVSRGDVGAATVSERSHDPFRARSGAASMRLLGLAKQVRLASYLPRKNSD